MVSRRSASIRSKWCGWIGSRRSFSFRECAMTPRLSWCTGAPLLEPSLNTLSAVVLYAGWCPRAFRARVVEPAPSSVPIRLCSAAGDGGADMPLGPNIITTSVPVTEPRLRLKPAAPVTGYVDGAWWPRNRDLSAELPSLLAALGSRLARIVRGTYQLGEC